MFISEIYDHLGVLLYFSRIVSSGVAGFSLRKQPLRKQNNCYSFVFVLQIHPDPYGL